MADTRHFFGRVSELDGKEVSMAGGSVDLADNTAEDVQTGLSDVKAAIASEDTEAVAVAGTKLLCTVKDQTVAANKGKITIQAIGATGTTVAHWVAVGIGGTQSNV